MHSIFWFRTRQWVLSRVLHLTEHKKQTLLAAPDEMCIRDRDQTGNPAQADLAGDFAGCLLVDAVQKRIFTSAELLSAVHINRGQRFGRFDHEESAGRQIHTFVECLFYVIFEIFFLRQRGKLILIPGQAAVEMCIRDSDMPAPSSGPSSSGFPTDTPYCLLKFHTCIRRYR